MGMKVEIDYDEFHQLKADAERWRWVNSHAEWYRSTCDDRDIHAYIKCRVPYDADLSCKGTRNWTIDKEIEKVNKI